LYFSDLAVIIALITIKIMRKSTAFLVILSLAIVIAGVWYWKTNVYSKEALKLEILGPASAQAGEEIEYLVKFKNNGKARLEKPELVFEYPANAMPSVIASSTNQFARVTQTIEDIYPGEERIVSFKARLFGKENDNLEAKAWLTYQPKNLKAKYESKTSFISQIQFVPLTFEFDLPAKAEPGDDLEFSLNYFSNMQGILDNLRVKVFYPEDFRFFTASPKPLGENEWKPQPLSSADGGRITIRGNIEGREGEKKMFRAQLGIVKDDTFIALKDAAQGVEITQPSLYISQMVNGSQNYVANIGDILHYEIFFQNIGKKPIEKRFLLLSLESDFFDLDTLRTLSGDVGKGDNSIIWDWKNVSDLRYLDPDEEGKVEFWIKAKDGLNGRERKNPVLVDKITAGGAQKVFEMKINSTVAVVQNAYFQDAQFNSSGPASAIANTFSIFWEIENSWNDLDNVKVRATLPSNVRPTGRTSPIDAKFTFDPSSRQVVWSIGSIPAFVTSENPASNLSSLWFQVEVDMNNASTTNAGILVNEAEITAQDAFTGEDISEKTKAITISSAAVGPQLPKEASEVEAGQ